MSNIKFGTEGWRGRVANTYPFAHLHHRHKDACTENTTVLDMINITVSHNPPHNGGIKVYNDHIASYTLGEHRSFQYADKFSNHSMEESMDTTLLALAIICLTLVALAAIGNHTATKAVDAVLKMFRIK